MGRPDRDFSAWCRFVSLLQFTSFLSVRVFRLGRSLSYEENFRAECIENGDECSMSNV
jgi:hypothetical protein